MPRRSSTDKRRLDDHCLDGCGEAYASAASTNVIVGNGLPTKLIVLSQESDPKGSQTTAGKTSDPHNTDSRSAFTVTVRATDSTLQY